MINNSYHFLRIMFFWVKYFVLINYNPVLDRPTVTKTIPIVLYKKQIESKFNLETHVYFFILISITLLMVSIELMQK